MKKKLRYHRSKTEGRQLAMPEGLPGARGRANWHVKKVLPGETPSTLNLLGGDARMSVPAEGPMAKLTVIHEMLHAAHSPLESPQPIPRGGGEPDIDVQAVLIAEEIRINTMMRHNMGRVWTNNNMDEEGMKEVILFAVNHPNPNTVRMLLEQHLCAWPLTKYLLEDFWSDVLSTVQEVIVDPTTRPDLVEYLKQIRQWISGVTRNVYNAGFTSDNKRSFIKGTIPSWKDFTIPVAEYLDRAFQSIDEASKIAQEAANAATAPTGIPEDLEALMKRFKRGETERQMNGLAADPTGKRNPPKFIEQEARREPQWGEMEIIEPPRPDRLAGKHLQKSKYHATDMGVVPRNIHRGIIDGQVFSVKRSLPGGAVLVDDSGSMSWLPEEIEAIMIAAPAVVIAAYSGARTHGELKILAKDKRRVAPSDIKTRYGGNDIDFPALEWLAEQAEPRIWVSDGQVHAGRGGDALLAAEQCLQFCVDNKINLVPTAEAAHEVFVGKRELYR